MHEEQLASLHAICMLLLSRSKEASSVVKATITWALIRNRSSDIESTVKSRMATLDLDVSDVDSEYSDRFLEDLSYSQSSSDEGSKSALVAQLQDSLVKNEPTSSSPAITTKKTKQTTKGKATTDLVYLGRTVRTPMKLTKSSTMDSSTESVGSTSKQSKQFSTSTDVRDACYSEWLSRKRSSISLDQDVKQKALEEKERKISLKKVGTMRSYHRNGVWVDVDHNTLWLHSLKCLVTKRVVVSGIGAMTLDNDRLQLH